jgi:hypothetical protein
MNNDIKMRFVQSILAVSMLMVPVIIAAANDPAEKASTGAEGTSDWMVLFDGTSFTGWEGNLDWFRIEDGAIVGGSMDKPVPRNEFLCFKSEFSDFVLELETKLVGENANAGIQIRSRRIPNHHEMIGYQADLGQQYWGCLYDESRRNRILAQPDPDVIGPIIRKNDWNRYVIRCEGKRIQLWFNGVQTVDYTETDDSIEQTGLIAVQIHSGGPSEAWYRNIRLKRLDKGE